jgi:hypothetical protein
MHITDNNNNNFRPNGWTAVCSSAGRMENKTVIACWKLQVTQVILKAGNLPTWAPNRDISFSYILLFCYGF